MLDRTTGVRIGTQRWTTEQIEQIKQWRFEGLSFADIGKHYNVSRNAIAGICDRNKIASVYTKNVALEWSPERVARFHELWDTGVPGTVIAIEFGCSDRTVSKWAIIMGLGTRRRKAAKRASAAGTKGVFIDLPSDGIPDEQRKTFAELERHHCRWMVGDPQAEHFYCGGTVLADGESFCLHHYQRVYR